jgi:predicted HAD superfamily Cof-like phosphohydrolase
MEKQLLQVREFQVAFNAPLPDKPRMLSKSRAILRQKLLQEEVDELKAARNLIDVSDALADILYITFGTAHEFGLADRLSMLFDEVHTSNMTKLGEDGKPIYREDGKVLKPVGYRAPNLRPIIERDFTVYKNSEAMQELAKEVKEASEKKVVNKIKSKLNLLDRVLFWVSNKIEARLKKRVQVDFPMSVFDKISVTVYGKKYEVEE